MLAVVATGPSGVAVHLFDDEGSALTTATADGSAHDVAPAGLPDASLGASPSGLPAAAAAAQPAGLLADAPEAGDDATSDVATGLHAVAAIEAEHHPRWIFDSVTDDYLPLRSAGIRLRRCHDISLTERILLGRAGRFGEPCRTAAVLARAAGLAAPPDPDPIDRSTAAAPQLGLFDVAPGREQNRPTPTELVRAYRDQTDRVAALATGPIVAAAGVTVAPGALRLLIAAESGSALVATEMTHHGLPWDAATHERILQEKLGPRPAPGSRPVRMAALAERISDAFGFPVNPDSALDLRHAFQRAGFDIESTRAWVLREIDHPAVASVLAYKDLARLYTANGWNWLDQWVSGGRLISEYLPGAVVSGRWATRGGGGLQLPKSVRAAAVAQPGHVLVVADAAQLEPRVWAALSHDPGLAAAARGADMYAAIAARGFGGDRAHAKLAMLGGMYGQTSGEAARLMATMRTQFARAVDFVEGAARRGESGAVVQTVLGRVCPPPSEAWRRLVGASSDDDGRARRAARDRGRFTRNFVIQGSAADWAAVWLTVLRLALQDMPAAELVLFQHDEIVVHAPVGEAEAVGRLIVEAADSARDLVFPGSAVQIPVRPVTASNYAEAK